MDLSEINPSFNELLNQVNVVNFNDNELDFQKNIIKKYTDFKSFNNYIEKRHFFLQI